jgi:predicted N-acetyltransferase YhbS
MATRTESLVEVRCAEAADRPAILELLAASLGWSTDERFDAFFSWKHEENPFGRSPAWVAVDGGEVVGYRTFMRWELIAIDGTVLRAVRAVDTATHPAHQGRGIFRQLTLQALDDLHAEGVAFVFNTPNDKSRPGYLKMGWIPVGRLGVSARVLSLVAPWQLARARVPAELWSVSSTGGRPAPEVLADPGLGDLVGSLPVGGGLTTPRTSAYLRWRYAFAPLAYRAVTLDHDVRAGLAIFRVRRRGPARECVLCEVLAPDGEPGASRALIRSVVRACGADYVIRSGGPLVDRRGFIRLPRQGPMLTWRRLAAHTPGGHLSDWDLALGDVELF